MHECTWAASKVDACKANIYDQNSRERYTLCDVGEALGLQSQALREIGLAAGKVKALQGKVSLCQNRD